LGDSIEAGEHCMPSDEFFVHVDGMSKPHLSIKKQALIGLAALAALLCVCARLVEWRSTMVRMALFRFF
jgi:hypothetical protein